MSAAEHSSESLLKVHTLCADLRHGIAPFVASADQLHRMALNAEITAARAAGEHAEPISVLARELVQQSQVIQQTMADLDRATQSIARIATATSVQDRQLRQMQRAEARLSPGTANHALALRSVTERTTAIREKLSGSAAELRRAAKQLRRLNRVNLFLGVVATQVKVIVAHSASTLGALSTMGDALHELSRDGADKMSDLADGLASAAQSIEDW